MPDDEAVIEAMVLAMQRADKPDENWKVALSDDEYPRVARRQLAAHRAMIKAEKEQGE